MVIDTFIFSRLLYGLLHLMMFLPLQLHPKIQYEGISYLPKLPFRIVEEIKKTNFQPIVETLSSLFKFIGLVV